jgi:hypothetical protein
MHLEETRGPHAEAVASRGPAQADRPDQAPRGPDQVVLGSRKYVSMVLRYNLLADSPYTLSHVLDHGRDRPIESFAVHPPSIRLVEQ